MAVKVIEPKELGKPAGMYSYGMLASGGDLLVVAGQTGTDATGKVAGLDIASQTKQSLDNIRAVVTAAGCSMRDIIRFQTFLTRAEDLDAFRKARADAYRASFGDGPYPPNTLLVISRLAHPDYLVEIEALAWKHARPAAAPKAKAARRKAPARKRRR
jgi:enamine deaminase RidA (YjgF/YER057c/UK114 family)